MKGDYMRRCCVFGLAGFLPTLPFILCCYVSAGESDWGIYHIDEMASHYYEVKSIDHLEKNILSVRAKIIPKNGNKGLLKDIYAKDICEGIDFPNTKEIKCTIEINCLNQSYRVVGGLFEQKLEASICEPRHDSVKWNDIPSESPIQRLSKIICPR
jgi:hypothetical protein